MAFRIKENDTRPRYVVALLDNFGEEDEAPIDLTTAASVKFLMRLASVGGDDAPKVENSADCAITDAANGVVTYTWQEGDTDTQGLYFAEFEITWNDDGVETVPNGATDEAEVDPDDYLQIVIKEDLG